MSIYPTSEQVQKLVAGPQDQPVVMINLLPFESQADGPEEGMSGEEAYRRYGIKMREFVESKGGCFIWVGRIDPQVIGEGGEGFHAAGLVEYPSRKAFLEIASDPHVQEDIGAYREADLESQWLLAATEMPS